ncbi:serum opacification factor [Streptococcus uberis]|nr:serum opacification factor [Streptococcus uberis]MCK1256707.1 serum opacification factor [Streptococcus uberis]
MVLFSQGEATISYDIKEKDKLEQNVVKEPITSSNPLLPWPFYFDYTNRRANLVEEGRKIQNLLKKLGIKRYEGILDDLANQGNSIFSFGSDIFGTNNPLDFLTMSDLDTSKQSESSFNYFKQIGEGYHHRSYYTRKIDEVPFKNVVQKIVKNKLEKLKEKVESNYGWFDVLGISKLTNTISNALGINELEEKLVNKVVDYLFYKRNYIYYNHNLSAQAEAKMARDEGILFHSFDVTMPNANNRYKRSGENSEVEKRNKKFDKYLEEMSEGQKFFKDVDNADKFKDFLTEIKVTETFTDRVNVDKDSLKENNKGTDGLSVKHTPASNSSSLLSLIFSPTPAKESLTWTISKEKLKDAFEQRTPLELTYKLKVEKDKFKSASPTRAKRSLETPESNKAITEKVISGKVAYKINGNSGKETSIGDVTLTFSKVTVPVPDIDEEIVIPPTPDKPLVEPMLPLQPSNPIVPAPELPDVEIPEIENEPGLPSLPEMEQPDQDSQEISGQSQIVDIVEDTLPGVSGQQSSSEETEITEDTRPESDNEIIVGGQSELVDIVEDTQPSLSGHQSESQETVTVEDTQPNQTNILIGGQSEIVDIIENTQAGMTGQYSSTDQLTIVEDTLPEQMEETDEIKADSQVMDIPKVNDTNNDKGAKASVAFDVEESKVVSTQDIKPSTYVKGDNQLPQTGDDDNVNAFFTLAALSVIGAAGLRQNKRREKERN